MATHEAVNNAVLDAFFAHNTWANLKSLDYCANLTDAQLDSTATGGYGTIRDTLHHILRAEIGYVSRVTGEKPASGFTRDDRPSFDQMRDVARWTGVELLKLAQSARADSMVVEETEDEWVEYSLASLIVQAITHAAEHRAQINAIITHLGMEPPDVSLWCYLEEIDAIKVTAK